jgi:hypothetical protein
VPETLLVVFKGKNLKEDILTIEQKMLFKCIDIKFTNKLLKIKVVIEFNEGKISKKLIKHVFKKLKKNLKRMSISFFKLVK